MTNYDTRNFDKVINGIHVMGTEWGKQATVADSKQTFAGMQRTLNERRFFAENEYNDKKQDFDKISEIYSPAVVNRERTRFNAAWTETSGALTAALKAEVKSLAQRKRKAVSDMITTPPSDKQQRLLNSLSARAGHIEMLELTSILPSMFENYQAMKQLQLIGAQNGTSISLPTQLDCTTMFENIDKAEEFLLGACEHIMDSKNKMPIQYHAFFTVDSENPDFIQDPYYRSYCEVLDSVPQLNQCEVNKNGLTDSEKVIVNYLFHDVAKLDASNDTDEMKIMQHTQKVMQQHPEIIDTLKLSDYKDYVKTVEAANAKKQEANSTAE